MLPDGFEKFEKFDIHSTKYKSVNDQPIGVDVLIPKNAKPGKLPVIVRFHGGYLVSTSKAIVRGRGLIDRIKVTGASLFPLFFASWLLEYAALNSAIIISADYRLLPESSASDAIEDVTDFWKWFNNDLGSFLFEANSTKGVDLGQILLVGDSAGGYLAVQSVFIQPACVIRAIIGMYPMIDIRSDFFQKKYEKPILGHSPVPSEVVDEHLQSIRPGQIVSTANPPARWELAVSLVQNGRYLEFFGTEPDLFPLERLDQVRGMPPFFIFHGNEDSAIPVDGSKKFAAALKTAHPETEVKLETQPGNHGFDTMATLETKWLNEGLAFISKHWLRA